MYKISQYESIKSKDNVEINIEDYANSVKYGTNQDAVIKGRLAKQQGDLDLYKKIKSASKVVTPTGTYESGQAKTGNNIKLNGLICMDIDTDVTDKERHDISNDPYTFIVHDSFGGDGICVFVKVDVSKMNDAYDAISKYYFDEYGIKTDPSGKNINRLRFLSFDPNIIVNEKSKKFVVKVEKKDVKPLNIDYVFTPSDFDNILDQIKSRSIDLCREDYYRYIRIGASLASEFGEGGRDTFHFICSYGSKYNRKHTDRDYSGFMKNNERVKIGTFYYYCKEEGISIYSPKTKAIINRVKVSKSQGNPTVDSVINNLKDANGIEVDDIDKELIQRLIDSKIDYSHLANEELTDIEKLANFIVDCYDPSVDELTHTYFINGKRMTDSVVNDIYINCTKEFDFNINISDIRSILNSSYARKINLLNDFIRENSDLKPDGYIDEYASYIHPQTEYNKWAFKKWIVGAVHNWTRDFEQVLTCPLTMVLAGSKHGTGKTSWFRNIMPNELRKYMVESKLDGKDKDSMFRLSTSLLILDDEFGSKAFKDNKAYKQISDTDTITMRRPYGREDETFKRRAILGGTTNEIDILNDVTGNRRILPINVESIEYEKCLKMDKTKLIMEAYNLLKSGFEWQLYSDEDVQYIKDNTQMNESVIPLEETFWDLFRLENEGEYYNEYIFNQGDILKYIYLNTPFKPTKYELKEIFVKNKLEYKTHRIDGIVKKGVKLYCRILVDLPKDIPF